MIRNRVYFEKILTPEEQEEFISAFDEVKADLDYYLDSKQSKNLYTFINLAFTWEDTPQGHDYWSDMSTREYDKNLLIAPEPGKEDLPSVRVYVVGNDLDYYFWLNNSDKYNFTLVDSIIKADLMIFTGGSDVSPVLYSSEIPHHTVHDDFNRDQKETIEFQKGLELNIPMVGICRGAQFLCVMAGGKLVQHMSHPSNHRIFDVTGKEVEVTSSHHQMQLPPEGASILGFTKLAKKGFVNKYDVLTLDIDVENTYYPDINALGIQSHPEWQNKEKNKYFINLIEDFIEKTGFFAEGVIYTQEQAIKVLEEHFTSPYTVPGSFQGYEYYIKVDPDAMQEGMVQDEEEPINFE
jgi:gamma-glutamyl-gamma-aminobutyrate hydrolase PuuD